MNNNDILIRLRYALNIKDSDMMKIFKLGGIDVTLEEVQKILMKKESYHNEDDTNSFIREMGKECTNHMLDSFLNGFIIYKRGVQDTHQENKDRQEQTLNNRNVNNIMLKKLKIALSLTSEDVIEILEKTGVVITKSELSAVLRKEGQRNYKECGDRYARNFLKGLAIKFRE